MSDYTSIIVLISTRALKTLRRVGQEKERSIEDLASAAIENAALEVEKNERFQDGPPW